MEILLSILEKILAELIKDIFLLLIFRTLNKVSYNFDKQQIVIAL